MEAAALSGISKKRARAPKKTISKASTPPQIAVAVPPTAESAVSSPAKPPLPSVVASIYDNLGELPEAYGSGRLFLTACGPHTLYCYWDYTWHQLEEMRHVARYGELKLRIYQIHQGNSLLKQEIALNPCTRNWTIPIGIPNSQFYAEFGYYHHDGNFILKSRSPNTRTPPDQISPLTEARFVTIPFRLTFRELYEMVRAHFKDQEELVDVLYRLQLAGFPFPFEYEGKAGESLDEHLLVRMFGDDLFRRIRMGSEELTQWLKKKMTEQVTSGMFAPSSPMGASFGVERSRGFWFNVNAELIVYGATEPDAKVVFDGKKIPLNEDGTFRFQFALPDGNYMTPISATSPDAQETREVNLHFRRGTSQGGEVGVVPHSPELKLPPTSSVSHRSYFWE
jgi:uncharacterized protein